MSARAALLVVAALLVPLAPVRAGVVWHDGDLDSAMRVARASNKLVVLDCWARWCTFCFTMDDNVWSRDDLARELAREAVPIKLEVDVARGIGADIAQRYDVEGLPLVLVIDPESQRALVRLTGYHEGDAILKAIDEARVQLALDRDLGGDDTDSTALVTLATRRLRSGDLAGAEPLLVRALERDAACKRDDADDAALALADLLYQRSDEAGAARVLADASLRCKGASGEAEIWRRRSELAERAGEEALLAVLEERAARFPDDAETALVRARALAQAEGASDRAFAAARRALELAPGDTRPRAILAKLHFDKRELERAIALVDEAIALDPHDRDLRELRLRIELARRQR